MCCKCSVTLSPCHHCAATRLPVADSNVRTPAGCPAISLVRCRPLPLPQKNAISITRACDDAPDRVGDMSAASTTRPDAATARAGAEVSMVTQNPSLTFPTEVDMGQHDARRAPPPALHTAGTAPAEDAGAANSERPKLARNQLPPAPPHQPMGALGQALRKHLDAQREKARLPTVDTAVLQFRVEMAAEAPQPLPEVLLVAPIVWWLALAR